MSHRIRPATVRLGAAAVAFASAFAATAVALLATAPTASAATQIWVMPSSGSVKIFGHGYGHGHGMSQYGARGAAIAGLNAAQIVAFYYPGTQRTTVSSTARITVQLSGAGSNTTVGAASGLQVTGVGLLGTPGATHYRLVPSGAGFALQARVNGAWSTKRTGLPSRSYFSASSGHVRLYRADGTSTDYRGAVGSVRSGSGGVTINLVGIDGYTMGVVPREMPASWQAAAVQAQAIAARSYGYYAVVHPSSSLYDICDTSWCQVYGGMTHYDSQGNVLWQDYPPAATATARQVLTYNGSVIFAQFSASSGGWTVAGGQPYLVAKADKYDNAASGDPYRNWTRSVPVSSIAAYYGLSRVTSIEITQRDGHGDWGGRVLAGYVNGVAGGASKHIATDGWDLQDAMNLPHNWMTANVLPAGADPTGWVNGAYLNLLGRAADQAGSVKWVTTLQTGTPPLTVANAITFSSEGRRYVVRWLFQGLLGRAATSTDLSYWTRYLAGGHTVLDVQARILASNEYYARVGSTQRQYINSLYQSPLVLGRAPDTSGVAYWLAALGSGSSREDIARQLLTSDEGARHAVTRAYADVLARAPDRYGLSTWAGRYPGLGYDLFALKARLVASTEYRRTFGL